MLAAAAEAVKRGVEAHPVRPRLLDSGYHSPYALSARTRARRCSSPPAAPTSSPAGLAGPRSRLRKPEKFVGAATPLEVDGRRAGREADGADGRLRAERQADAALRHGQPAPAPSSSRTEPTRSASRARSASRPCPTSRTARRGSSSPRRARCSTASGPSQSTATRDVQVRLERPRVSVVSTHHYVNLGGTEMVVYRATPADVASGVLVGDLEYPGYPASGATVEGVKIDDPAVRIAFFALRYDQDLNTPIRLFARDEAGNTARADFDYRTFPKPFKKSRIELDDTFLDRVVPAILEGTTEVKPEGDTLAKFLVINGELRRKNAEKIASFAKQTAPEMLWRGVVFHPFTNTAVESAFADQRTYVYKGKEVDQQIHLGFDLASFAGTPIVAANRGKVLFADELGIYGNCVILDHGMGVQSLYGHLSSIDVKAGQTGREGAGARPERHDRPGRRRSPALHDARQRPDGEPGRVVGRALDPGPDPAEAEAAKLEIRAYLPYRLKLLAIRNSKTCPSNHLRLLPAVALLTLAAACSGEAPEPARAAGRRQARRRLEGRHRRRAGRARGRRARRTRPIKLTADPYCARVHPNGARFETLRRRATAGSRTSSSTSRTASATTTSTRRPSR